MIRKRLGLPDFVEGALFVALAMMFSRGAVVLASALVASAFGTEAFASFTFVHLTATILANGAMLGMMNGLPRFVAKMNVDHSAEALSQVLIAGTTVLLGLCVAAAAVLMLPTSFIGLPDSAQKPVLIALIFGVGLANVLTGANNGMERFFWVAASSFAFGLTLLAGVFATTTMNLPQWPLRVYLISTGISVLVMLPGIARPVIRRYQAHGAPVTRASVRAVGDYIGPMFLVTLATSTGAWLAGRTLLDQPNGAHAYAEFALGLQWFGLAAMSANVISRTVMPRFTRNVWHDDMASQRQTLRSATIFSVLGALAVLALVGATFPLIISLYGPGFADTFWSVMLFVGAAVISAPASILTSALVAAARYSLVIWPILLWWCISVVGAIIVADKGPLPVIGCIFAGYLAQLAILLLSADRTISLSYREADSG